MTGGWDTAQGIPDADTGVPDMTVRYAQNCFVYDRHQVRVAFGGQDAVVRSNEVFSVPRPTHRFLSTYANISGSTRVALRWTLKVEVLDSPSTRTVEACTR